MTRVRQWGTRFIQHCHRSVFAVERGASPSRRCRRSIPSGETFPAPSTAAYSRTTTASQTHSASASGRGEIRAPAFSFRRLAPLRPVRLRSPQPTTSVEAGWNTYASSSRTSFVRSPMPSAWSARHRVKATPDAFERTGMGDLPWGSIQIALWRGGFVRAEAVKDHDVRVRAGSVLGRFSKRRHPPRGWPRTPGAAASGSSV